LYRVVAVVGCLLLSQLSLLIYPVLNFAHHTATLIQLILWTRKLGCLTTYFSADILLSLENRITIRTSCLDHCSSRVAMFHW